jgi:hypothetical protein
MTRLDDKALALDIEEAQWIGHSARIEDCRRHQELIRSIYFRMARSGSLDHWPAGIECPALTDFGHPRHAVAPEPWVFLNERLEVVLSDARRIYGCEWFGGVDNIKEDHMRSAALFTVEAHRKGASYYVPAMIPGFTLMAHDETSLRWMRVAIEALRQAIQDGEAAP